jgi:DNA-binding protein HU-beta
MNKLHLIDYVSDEAGITKADASRVVEAVIKGMSEALKGNRRVALMGFGTFNVVKRNAKNGRNPKTGESVKVPAKKVIKFKTSAELQSAINRR